MLLKLVGEAWTRIADETAAITADVTKKHVFPKKFKGVVGDKWGGKNKGFIDRMSLKTVVDLPIM